MKFALIISFVFSVLAVACPLDEHQKLERNLELKIKTFHAQFNEERFSEIYNTANDELKNQQDEAKFVESLILAKSKTGTIKTDGWVDLPSDYKRYARLSVGQNDEKIEYRNVMTCENGIGLEKFIFRVSNEKIELISYELEKVGKKFKFTGKDGTEYVLGKDE